LVGKLLRSILESYSVSRQLISLTLDFGLSRLQFSKPTLQRFRRLTGLQQHGHRISWL
jgi:hypothetical protein